MAIMNTLSSHTDVLLSLSLYLSSCVPSGTQTTDRRCRLLELHWFVCLVSVLLPQTKGLLYSDCLVRWLDWQTRALSTSTLCRPV